MDDPLDGGGHFVRLLPRRLPVQLRQVRREVLLQQRVDDPLRIVVEILEARLDEPGAQVGEQLSNLLHVSHPCCCEMSSTFLFQH